MILTEQLKAIFFKQWKPQPKIPVSEWADKNLYLPPEYASEPGQWNTARAPYQREMMDVVIDENVNQVVLCTSAQVGKSSILDNILCYYIEHEPSPMMHVLPTQDDASDFSENRLMPLFRDSRSLNRIFNYNNNSVRRKGDKIRKKKFPGGRLTLLGSNSPSGLSRISVRIVFLDEIDKYGSTKNGDPIKLATKRAQTFYNRKIIMASTPTIEGASRIKFEYLNSDQRKYYVPCPACKEMQILKWENIFYEKDKKKIPKPESVRYICDHCGHKIKDEQKMKMLIKGEWRAAKPFSGTAGFWINEMYSPWSSWPQMVKDWYEAQKNITGMQNFMNESLGETYTEQGIEVKENRLLNRLEDYKKVPDQVKILTAGVDIQADRIEGEIVGYGQGETSWGIEYFIINGNPAIDMTWELLAQKLASSYEREDGQRMRVTCAFIDSGYHTNEVYKFCKRYEIVRYYASKGMQQVGRPLVGHRPSIVGSLKTKLFIIGVDTAKELIYNRLMLEDENQPGFMHFPKYYTEDYFKMLTAEKALMKKDNSGYIYRKWVKKRRRNEALDIRVMSLAALNILNVNWERLKEDRNYISPGTPSGTKRKKIRHKGI